MFVYKVMLANTIIGCQLVSNMALLKWLCVLDDRATYKVHTHWCLTSSHNKSIQ